MPNNNPFQITPGGRLVDLRIFVASLATGDFLSSVVEDPSHMTDGITVTAIAIIQVPSINEDGVTFPEKTSFEFTIDASTEINVDDENGQRIHVYFIYVTQGGDTLRLDVVFEIPLAIESD